jgi:hypothetical protein
MKNLASRALVSLPFLVSLAACSAGINDLSGDGGGNAGGSDAVGGRGGGEAATTSTSTTSTGMSTGAFMGTGGSDPMPMGCESAPDEDKDMDGFSKAQGDCNDCDANVNPGAIEVIGEADGMGGAGGYVPADEDCDGTVDNPPMPCDTGLALDSANANDAAKAIELCKTSAGPNDWGVVSAQWVRANGTPAVTPSLAFGILPNFGPNLTPQAGASMLGVSSGHARSASQPGACGQLTCQTTGAGTPPPGFPQDVPNCSGGTNINDDIALDVTLRAPKNATGYKFDFDFYSFEYPEWVCTTFNDQFIALVNPAPMGSINGNISFDSMGNPVSVNIAFFNVCSGCPQGTGELSGTGFDTWNDAGATSWLQTTAPIQGGDTFSIRWAIWDTGDTAYDSTALIDNFQWIANGGTVDVGTDPVPPPQ